MDSLTITLQGIYGQDIKRKEVNEALWDKIQEIWDMFKTGTPKFRFHICSNKEKPVDVNKQKFQKHLDPFKFVSYFYYDQEDIAATILERKESRINGVVNFIGQNYFSKGDVSLRGVVATIPAVDLIELIRHYTLDARSLL